MILKFKKENGNWSYITLKDFEIGEIRLRGDVSLDTILSNYENSSKYPFLNDADEFRDVVGKLIYRKIRCNFSLYVNFPIDTVLNKLKYIFVKGNEYNEHVGDVYVFTMEAYLMSDDGKTIERLK